MARFMGVVQGSRGETSRLGGTSSGIRAQAQGWQAGVKVYGSVEGEQDDANDKFNIYITNGSSGGAYPSLLGTVREFRGEVLFEPAEWLVDAIKNGQSQPPVFSRV